MLNVVHQPADEDDLIRSVNLAKTYLAPGAQHYLYGVDRQSVEVPNRINQYLWVKVGKRSGAEGLGELASTIQDLKLAPASEASHLAALEEIDEALDILGKPRASITQIALLYQPFRLYVELESGDDKFIMSYQKSYSNGTGHRMLMDGQRPKIMDSATHGQSLVAWLAGIGVEHKPERRLSLYVRIPMPERPETDEQRNALINEIALDMGAIQDGMKHRYDSTTAQQRWDFEFREQGLTFETLFAGNTARDAAIQYCAARNYPCGKRRFC